MPLLEKDDLYHVYFWNWRSRARVKGLSGPGSDKVIPTDGYQVLYLINWIADRHEIQNKDTGTQIEKFIRSYLIGKSRTEQELAITIQDEFSLPVSGD